MAESGIHHHSEAYAQIWKDIVVMIDADFDFNILLGEDEAIDHIQIDESKFGKRKYHRGHHVEGVWVFGLIEAIPDGIRRVWKTDENRYVEIPKYKAGRRFFCTVPARNEATLLAIIRKYVKPGSTIRSDGWKGYNNLHMPEVVETTVGD